jgi:hypothetical protein
VFSLEAFSAGEQGVHRKGKEMVQRREGSCVIAHKKIKERLEEVRVGSQKERGMATEKH